MLFGSRGFDDPRSPKAVPFSAGSVVMEQEPQEWTESMVGFQMCVTVGSARPDSDTRWAHRAEVLAAWLVDAWCREHGGA